MINELKAAAEKAHAQYENEQARLVALGMKSKDRYEALKPLKAAADEAWGAYKEAGTKKVLKRVRAHINNINAQARAEKLARSPYKQRKAGLIA
jgi:hypothetical protein